MSKKEPVVKPRIRTVEHLPGWGWIARCPFSGFDLFEPGFVWRTRSVARDVVAERRRNGRDEKLEARQRALLLGTPNQKGRFHD